jgi:hypothetical protein
MPITVTLNLFQGLTCPRRKSKILKQVQDDECGELKQCLDAELES